VIHIAICSHHRCIDDVLLVVLVDSSVFTGRIYELLCGANAILSLVECVVVHRIFTCISFYNHPYVFVSYLTALHYCFDF
jgi:hypothetical protein